MSKYFNKTKTAPTPIIPRTVRDCKKTLRFAQIHKFPTIFSLGVDRLSAYIEKNNEKN